MSAPSFGPDKPATWPSDVDSWFQVSYPVDVIKTREVEFPSSNSYHQIFPNVFSRDQFDLAVYQSDSTTLNELMAALPQWEYYPPANAVNHHPWRIIWPYHPVISTISEKGKPRSFTEHFCTYDQLPQGHQDDAPAALEDNQKNLIFHKTYHILQSTTKYLPSDGRWPITLLNTSLQDQLLHTSKPSKLEPLAFPPSPTLSVLVAPKLLTGVIEWWRVRNGLQIGQVSPRIVPLRESQFSHTNPPKHPHPLRPLSTRTCLLARLKLHLLPKLPWNLTHNRDRHTTCYTANGGSTLHPIWLSLHTRTAAVGPILSSTLLCHALLCLRPWRRSVRYLSLSTPYRTWPSRLRIP